MRRYWRPVAAAGEFTEQTPIRPVKILGEELVVYRDKQGKYGLVGEHCPHRLASLAYGRVDDEGIRCPYHGWKFDRTGKCLEQPAEPAGSTFKERIKHVAYPVEPLGGLIFAYLGPEPRPLLPRWDVLAWENGRRWIVKESIIDCNWLQERLGVEDEGIIILRKLLKEQIENVQNGRDPIGMIRDPAKNRIIELNVINERIGLYRPASLTQDRAIAS